MVSGGGIHGENIYRLSGGIHGIIKRKVYPEVPPKVEYSLTAMGKDLKDVIEVMRIFGKKYKGKSDLYGTGGEKKLSDKASYDRTS